MRPYRRRSGLWSRPWLRHLAGQHSRTKSRLQGKRSRLALAASRLLTRTLLLHLPQGQRHPWPVCHPSGSRCCCCRCPRLCSLACGVFRARCPRASGTASGSCRVLASGVGMNEFALFSVFCSAQARGGACVWEWEEWRIGGFRIRWIGWWTCLGVASGEGEGGTGAERVGKPTWGSHRAHSHCRDEGEGEEFCPFPLSYAPINKAKQPMALSGQVPPQSAPPPRTLPLESSEADHLRAALFLQSRRLTAQIPSRCALIRLHTYVRLFRDILASIWGPERAMDAPLAAIILPNSNRGHTDEPFPSDLFPCGRRADSLQSAPPVETRVTYGHSTEYDYGCRILEQVEGASPWIFGCFWSRPLG